MLTKDYRAASYRRKARAFRAMAVGCPEGERQERLLDMALVWERRAEAAEEFAGDGPPGGGTKLAP
jgi:hypothetical protein